MAIHAIVGLPGMGKSLYGVHVLRRDKGRRRISNLFPKSGEWEFGLLDDILTTGHAMALIDEAHMMFSSREFKKITQADLAPWQQHRKQALDLWFTVQNINRVDKAIRELAAYLHLVRRFGHLMLVTTYFPEELEKPNPSPLKRKLVYITKEDYNAYWTEQTIGDNEGNGYDLGRLARKPPKPPVYAATKGRLKGKELRFIAPTGIRLYCDQLTQRYQWKGTDEVVRILTSWFDLGYKLPPLSVGISYEFDGPTGLVTWTHSEYLAAGHAIPRELEYAWQAGEEALIARDRAVVERWKFSNQETVWGGGSGACASVAAPPRQMYAGSVTARE
jgi:hypothetical protein